MYYLIAFILEYIGINVKIVCIMNLQCQNSVLIMVLKAYPINQSNSSP